jgi:hypothetical protein
MYNKPYTLAVVTFLKNPAISKNMMHKVKMLGKNGARAKGIQNMIICKLIINKHNKICVGV